MALWLKQDDGTLVEVSGGGGGTFDGEHVPTGDPSDPAVGRVWLMRASFFTMGLRATGRVVVVARTTTTTICRWRAAQSTGDLDV